MLGGQLHPFKSQADEWWDEVKSTGDYVEAMTERCVQIDLADITRLEYGQDHRDLPCVTIYWSAGGRRCQKALEAPDNLDIAFRLRERIAPEAKFRKTRATVLSRLHRPLIMITVTLLFSGCMCGATFLPRGNPRNLDPNRIRNRFEALGDFITFIGPWGISALTLVILLGLSIWATIRVLDRPIIRYIELGRRKKRER